MAAAPSAPTLNGPGDNATLANFGPTLTWTNPAGVTQYHLQIVPANNDGPGVDLQVGSAGVSFTVPAPPNWYGLLPDMTYTWRVRVSNAPTFVTLADPSWSGFAQRRFRTPIVAAATISPVAPGNGAAVATLTPTLQWANSRTDVFYYELQLSKDPTFNTNAATATASVYTACCTAAPPIPRIATPSRRTRRWRTAPSITGGCAPGCRATAVR
ncbi:MAG: hypothetical protein EXR51_00785 [Dehalococcoidia bacterium]|nr:hypothetical protein [Dehalococcoidia bacterium]